MKNHYEPRKKKYVPLVRETKLIRIDSRTQIEVSVAIPDDVARERYHARHKIVPVPPDRVLYPMTEKECFKEIPAGSLEQIAILADETNLSEQE